MRQHYLNKKQVEVPGVTTVLQVLAKPELIHWSWKLGTEGKDYREVRDSAADIGTLVHHLIMCFWTGETPNHAGYTTEQVKQAYVCFDKFSAWLSGQNKLEPIIVEKPMISEVYQFGGTPDWYGIWHTDSKPLRLRDDYKTSNGIYRDMFYQLAGYKILGDENDCPADIHRIIRIPKNPDEDIEVVMRNDLSTESEIFLHCLEIYKLQRRVND